MLYKWIKWGQHDVLFTQKVFDQWLLIYLYQILPLSAFDISFDFSMAYNSAIISFVSKVCGIKKLTSRKSHVAIVCLVLRL